MYTRIIAQLAHLEQAANDKRRSHHDRSKDLLAAVGLFHYLLFIRGEDVLQVIADVEAHQAQMGSTQDGLPLQ